GPIEKRTVKRTAKSKFTINVFEPPIKSGDKPPGYPSHTNPIMRLAWSKDSTFLAALALSAHTAYVTVWDMKHWNPSNPQDTSILHQKRAVVTTEYQSGNLQDLSIGLAISSNGDQVVVYQEPMIGQWADGSDLERSTFCFRLLTPQPVQDATDAINATAATDITLNMEPTNEPSVVNVKSGNHHSRSTSVSTTTPLLNESVGKQAPLAHPTLKGFIGYGAYLTGRRSCGCDISDFTNAHSAHEDSEVGNRVSDSKDKTRSSGCNTQSTAPGESFAACNGIHLDIFKVKLKLNWEHTHSIKLTDLIPTINRRITCKTMMGAMSSNKFMWLEDSGLCCTIWDLHKGSNIAYLSNPDDMRLGRSDFRGSNTMSISPDESLVALASVDGTLTTFYANTGIAISSRKFPEHRIEYVAFNGQNNQVFAITRNRMTRNLISWILDPIQLECGVQANEAPVPIIGRTIHALFHDKDCESKRFICDANRNEVHFYVTHESVDNPTTEGDVILVDTTNTSYPSPKNPQAGDESNVERRPVAASEEVGGEHNRKTEKGLQEKRYEVRTAARRQPFHDGDSSICWVNSVSVVENPGPDEKSVFSFVPEPWMRVPAAAVRQPGNLLKVYFLPGQKRFVVTGIQTLQIWSLPTDGNNDFNLVFIWSRPRTKEDNWADGKGYHSELIGEYYHCISSQRIYLHPETGKVKADITLMGGSKDDVGIPYDLSGDTRLVFINCARSIHLLSAAFAYSSRTSDRVQKVSGKSLHTFKEHAEAIARFTRSHINRSLPIKSFYPSLPTEEISRRAETLHPITPTQEDQNIPVLPESWRLSVLSQVPCIGTSSCSDSIPKPPVGGDQKSSGNHQSPSNPQTQKAEENRVLRINSDIRPQKTLPDFARQTLPKKVVALLPRIWLPKVEDTSSQDDITLLTLLLDQSDLRDANFLFVEKLFTTTGHEWVPHASMALNPIKRVIDIKNERLLSVLIDYCINNAKKHHPVYLTPVLQCLSGISEWYPDILCELFMRASYIPARNLEYVTSHAIIANLRRSDWFTFLARLYSVGLFKGGSSGFSNSSDINRYKKPVFSVRSQLAFDSHIGFSGRRATHFPRSKAKERDQPTAAKRPRKIYVSPFQFKTMNGQNGSFLAQIAGKDFFDSPAIVASLWYKWNKSGLYFWYMRFMVVLTFFILVMAITAKQIQVSTLSDGDAPTADQIAARYLPEWRPIFKATIGIG
ncbi:hypothetical protein BGX34_004504, partial [Mortierella sp. NVP85]